MSPNDSREHQIDIAILQSLEQCGSYLLPEGALIQSVRHKLGQAYDSEIRQRLSIQDSRRRLLPIRTDAGLKYRITDDGRAWLAEYASP